jgi:hypothetical protein
MMSNAWLKLTLLQWLTLAPLASKTFKVLVSMSPYDERSLAKLR